MNPWVTVVVALLGLLGTGGGIAALLTVRATRRKILAQASQIQADADESVAGAVKVLIGGAADLVAPLKRELAATRLDLVKTHTSLSLVERRAAALERQMERLAHMIHDPYMTLERLRVMVPDPGTNGAASTSSPQ